MEFIKNIDVIIALAYMLVCLFVGLYKGKSVKNLKQFAIGNANAKSPLLVAVIFATLIGAGSTIGVVGEVCLLGLIYILCQLIVPISFIITSRIFGDRIQEFQGCLTVSHVMGKLYGSAGRWLTSIFSLAISAGVIAAQAIAIGHVFHYFFNIEVNHGILLSYAILTIYSTSGGIRSVVVTEVFQFAIFFFIIPLSCILFMSTLGNIENVMPALPAHYLNIEFTTSNILLIGSFAIYVLLPEYTAPAMQRYLMASSSAELKKSLKYITLIFIPFTLSLCFIAYAVQVSAPGLNPSNALLYFTNQLPIGIKGIMIAGLFAIFMSTAESWVNAAAVIVANDIVKPLFPGINDKRQLLIVRFFTIGVSLASISIAALGKDILELIWLLDSFWHPLILIPISAGFLGFKTNSKTFIANAIVALMFCILGRILAGKFGLASLSIGLLGSVIGFFGMHYWQVYRGTLNQPLPKVVLRLPKVKNPFADFSGQVRKFGEQVWREKPRFAVFGGFTLYYYFFFGLFLTYSQSHQILLILFALGFLMSGLLLMRDIFFSQEAQRKYVPFCWYAIVTFCLPCTGSYCLLASNGSDLWVVNGLVLLSATFYFLRAISSAVVITIGTVMGYTIFVSTHSYLSITVSTAPLLVPYVYLLLLTIVALFIRHNEKHHHEEIETMQALGGTIAHEVRSPIASMMMAGETVHNIINDVVTKAKEKGGNYHLVLKGQDYTMLVYLSENLKNLGSKGIEVINHILAMLRTSLSESKKEKVSIQTLIQQAIDEYKAHNTAVENVVVEVDKNFTLDCNPMQFKHLLFNLLKNAYKYNGNNVRVAIKVINGCLYFTDYGNGISEEILPYIFDRFYTKGAGGTGLGLAFCKMVMESLGGSISCKSKLGEYTTFTLAFQKMQGAQV